jgi:DNA-binding YbaB/EbfC family protein
VEPGGGLDFQQLIAAAAQMQDKLLSAQQELADATVEGTAGGGLVRAFVDGQGELVDLVIDPAAIDADDLAESAQTIADLVLAACRAAYLGVADLQQEMMGPLAGGLPGGGSGAGPAGLPDLSGLLGIGPPGRPDPAPSPGAAGTGTGTGGAGESPGEGREAEPPSGHRPPAGQEPPGAPRDGS